MTAIPIRIVHDELPDGRAKLRFENAPALRRFNHHERWRAQDAAKMTQLLAAFHRDPRGVVYMRKVAAAVLGGTPQMTAQYIASMAQLFNTKSSEAMNSETFMTIFAKDDFAQMMTAAAAASPQTLIKEHELPSESGMIFFETPQDLSFVLSDQHSPPGMLTQVRAVRWITAHFAEDQEPMLMWGMYVDPEIARKSDFERETEVVFPDEFYFYSNTFASAVTYFDASKLAELEPDPIPQPNLTISSLLRSITAIAASPQSIDASTNDQTKKKRKGRRNASSREREVRILSLVNPEHGRYELDAATGRRLRRHWVRGHWRSQWYPSIEEHKTIWIDGFIKGNADLGIIDSPKVYVAKAPTTIENDSEGITP